MNWRQNLTVLLADILRFTIRGALLTNGILMSIGLVYVVCKLVWYSLRFLDRTVFANPW